VLPAAGRGRLAPRSSTRQLLDTTQRVSEPGSHRDPAFVVSGDLLALIMVQGPTYLGPSFTYLGIGYISWTRSPAYHCLDRPLAPV